MIQVEERLLPKVWKTWAPSKVAVFSWQLLQDRLPTRQNLWQRGVIEDASASMCVFCGLGPESADHLFGSCDHISPIWYSILRWLGVQLVPSRGVLGLFEAFLGMSMAECLVDRVKLSSWKWFLGKNPDSPWGGLEVLFCFVLPVVVSCLSLPEGFYCARGALRGSRFGG
ncbi:receptor-like kinase, partial [Trifolium medium]|nr:receptor-like kinase [Trifolium medium]